MSRDCSSLRGIHFLLELSGLGFAGVRAPVFINCRDRLSPLTALVDWLELAGVQEIYFLDNDSQYEPLMHYFAATPHTVVPLGANYGRLAMWEAPGVFALTRNRPFVYTDPDIVPDPMCPLDAVGHFDELLARFPAVSKAGFGLRIDDLPDHYRHKAAVVDWEEQFWRLPLGGGAYYAPIDTTFALYRAGSPMRSDAIRTGPPYVARHTSWYIDFADLDEEERFYATRLAEDTEHSPGTSHWVSPELRPEFTRLAERLRTSDSARLGRLRSQLRWRLYERRALRRPAPEP